MTMDRDAVTREQIAAWAKLAGFTPAEFSERMFDAFGDFAIFARRDRAPSAAQLSTETVDKPVDRVGVFPNLERLEALAKHFEAGGSTLIGEGMSARYAEAIRALLAREVPSNVMAALDRMCTPLDESVLKGATAEADAHNMKLIRDYVLSTAPAQSCGDAEQADLTLIRALQKALAYWMPKVFDDRSAHDAYLLVGYDGADEQACWGDEMVAATQWTPVGESLPAEPGWYLAMLAPENDWGLMSDTPLQVEFDAYTNKPKAFTCFYDYRGDEDITAAVIAWMRTPALAAPQSSQPVEAGEPTGYRSIDPRFWNAPAPSAVVLDDERAAFIKAYMNARPASVHQAGDVFDQDWHGKQMWSAGIAFARAESPQAAAPINGIPATFAHDEGAIARCSYCGRYSLDRKTLSDRQPTCECGEKHGWSGSFVKPGPDAKWSGEAPQATATQPAQTERALTEHSEEAAIQAIAKTLARYGMEGVTRWICIDVLQAARAAHPETGADRD